MIRGLDRRLMLGALALALSAGLVAPGSAQSAYPTKPVHMIIPFAAGGGNDIFARLVGQKMSEELGQNFLIENKPGAAGRIAAAYVLSQPHDGYTVFVSATGVMSVSAAIYPKLAYHPTKSFIPLTQIANFPLILAVATDNPAKSVKELVAWAKANPDKVNYAISSPAFYIASELFKLKAGIPGLAIPYKSSNEMLLSVIGGQSQFTIVDPPPTIPQVKGGKVRALAVTGSERSPQLPDVPSMAEAGYPEVNVHLWSGLFVAAGTPPDIVAKLEASARKALADPGVRQKLTAMAVNPSGMSSEEFRKIIDNDIVTFRNVVEAAHLTFK